MCYPELQEVLSWCLTLEVLTWVLFFSSEKLRFVWTWLIWSHILGISILPWITESSTRILDLEFLLCAVCQEAGLYRLCHLFLKFVFFPCVANCGHWINVSEAMLNFSEIWSHSWRLYIKEEHSEYSQEIIFLSMSVLSRYSMSII